MTVPRGLEDARTDIDESDALLLEQLCGLDRLVEFPAAGHPFDARVADADGEIVAALVLDSRDDFEREPHAVEEAAAEAIVAPVDVGAHELGDQVAVGGVEFDAVEPCLLDPPCAFAELFDQIVDLFDGHGPDRFALGDLLGVDDFMAGGAGQVDQLVAGRHEVLAGPGGLAARVLDLHGAAGTVAVHGLRQFGQEGNMGILIDRDTGDRRPPRVAVGRRRTHDDQSAAALGGLFVVGDHPLVDGAIGVGRADVGRHVADPIGHLERSDPKG